MKKHIAPILSPNARLGIKTKFNNRSFNLADAVADVLLELTHVRASFTSYNVTEILRDLFPTTIIAHYPKQGTLSVREIVQNQMQTSLYDTIYETWDEQVDGHGVILFVPCIPKDRVHKKMDAAELDVLYNPWKYTAKNPIPQEIKKEETYLEPVLVGFGVYDSKTGRNLLAFSSVGPEADKEKANIITNSKYYNKKGEFLRRRFLDNADHF